MHSPVVNNHTILDGWAKASKRSVLAIEGCAALVMRHDAAKRVATLAVQLPILAAGR